MGNAGQAHFEITKVFEIAGRGVVLAGQIRSGVVRPGMLARLSLNSGLHIVTTVKSVEFVDHLGGKAELGLILNEEDLESRSLWMQLCQAGDVISLCEPTS
jgi:GTPase